MVGGLRRIPSVAYNAPEPIDAGDLPGREPAAYVLEGMPLAPSGYPEMTPDPVGPLWLEQASLLPADPCCFRRTLRVDPWWRWISCGLIPRVR